MKIPILGKSFLWFSLFKECITGLRYYSVSLVVFFLLFLFPFLSFAQFPYNESFRGLEAPGVIFGGTPTALLTAGKSLDTAKTNDVDGEGYLRLTNNLGDQTGYIYSNAVFPGTYGLHIEFDYFTRGGSGADGISFFLFDASVPNFTIGAFGGSLGYAQKLINNGNTKLNGVSKGYLGIGLDEYGNFSSEDEGRNSGLLKAKLSPDRVVLRGAGNGYNTDPNNYKYLTSAPTNTGTNAFKIAGGKRGAVAGDPEYRRVIINLEPRVGGGLIINVSIKHGNIVTPLIVNEPYATAVPAAGLKYGIASSTGGATNYHEIRGLEITVDPTKLATPVANDDIVNICQDYTVTTSKDIFANDDLKNAGGKANKEKVDLDPNTDGIYEQTIVQPGIGTFFFNQAAMLLEFKPDPAFNSTTSISYNFLDVYGAKSTTATVTVSTVLPKVTKQPVINPVCENSSFSTSVEGDGGSGQLSYQWQFSSDGKAPENSTKTWTNISGNSTAQTATLSVNNVVVGQNGWYYRVLLTSNAQGVTCPAYSSPARLVVNPLPTATISTATPVCPGSPDVALTFTGSKGTAPYTFTYTVNNGTPQTVTSATGSNTVNVYQSAAISGDFVYKITSISDASSTSCSVAQAVSSMVTVRPPATKPTITAGSEEFCQGTSLSISSSAESGNQWYKDGELIPGATEIDYLVTVAGKYTVSFTNSDACTTFSDPRTILVNPRPTKPILTSPSLSYCQNGGVLITSTEAASYFWFKNGTAIKVNGVLYNERTYLATEPGNYSVIVLSEKGCQSNPSNTLTITENPLPAAPTFTASATSFCTGSSVELTSSSATGNQWYKNDILITGATDAKYTVTQAGSYKVVFTNGSGCSASSASFDITIIPDPTITLTSDVSTISQKVCRNINITEITYAVTNATGVTVSGLPSSFTTNFNPTTKIFTINGSAAVSGEYSYTVSTTGGCTIASLTGKITVSPDASIVLTSGNANPSVCLNTGINEIKYTISNAVNYTITKLPDGVYSNISGSVITVSGNPNEVGEFPYTITTTGGCSSATISGIITSNALATVNKPDNQVLCNDKNSTTVEFSSNVVGTTYSWTNNDSSIGLADSGSGNIGSFKAVNNSNLPVTATITVRPSSAPGCVAGSETFTITVNPTAKLTKPIDQVNCNGSTTSKVVFSGPVVNTTYSWSIDHPEIGLTAGTGSEIAAFTAINVTRFPVVATITVTPSANGCPGEQQSFTITVNPKPTVEKPVSFEICNDVTTAKVVFAQVAGKEVNGTTFSWTIDRAEIGLNAGTGSEIAAFKAINLTSEPIIATITVTPIATSCPGDAETFTITVNPTPTVATPASFEVCNDKTTTRVAFSQVAGKEVTGTTFSWTNNKPGIGLAGSGTGDIESFKAVNLNNAPIIATITVIPTATSCPGEAKTFTITVNPTPTVDKPASIEVCNDAMTTPVTFTQVTGKEVSGTTFSWTNDKPGIGLAGSGTGDIGSFKAVNFTNAPIIATITVIPTATSCPGVPQTFTIIVNPTPTVEKPASIEVCTDASSTPVTFMQVAGKEVAGTTFSWTNDKPAIGLAGSGTGDIASFKAINLTNVPIIATITVTPTATACPGDAKTFTITVNPTPTVEKPVSIELCNDAMTPPVTFTQVAGKEVNGTTFSWTNDKPGIGLAGSGTGDIASFKAINLTNAPIIATITVIPTATACPGAPKTFTITVNPTSTVEKPASIEVCNDVMTSSVTFTQVAGKEVSGTTFNWTNDKPGIGLAGSGTGDIESFKAVNLTNAPIIATITVTPIATSCPGAVKTFTITVNPTPTVEKPASIELCNDATTTPVTFTQIAGKEVTGTTFSWTNNKPGIGLAGSGTGNIASFKAINLTNAPIIATITVIPTATACPGAPKTFTITVNPTPTVEKPASIELCNDAMTTSVTFTQAAGKEVNGTTFSWTNDKPGIGLAASGTGDIASFKAINLTNAPVIATITVIPTATACPGAPKTFTIIVNPTPTVEKPASIEVCNDAMTAPVTFTQIAGKEVTGTTFSWTNNKPGIGLAGSGTGDIESFKAINLTNAPIIATITVIPTATACAGVAETFTITVNPTPTVEKPASIEVCNDAMTTRVAFTQIAGKEVTGTTFSWTNDKPGIGLAGSGTGNIESFKAINLTNAPIIATITVIPTATACPGAPKTFTITVNPIPTVEKPASIEVCNDAMTTTLTFTPVVGKEVTGTTFSWTNNKPGIGLAGSGSGDIESFKAINLTNAPIIATITVIPAATACPGVAETFTITVNPTPTVVTPASIEVCNDAMSTAVTFTQIAGKEVAGTTFSWTNNEPGIGLAGSGTGDIASFKAINLTSAPIIVTITVIPTATACPGAPKTFTITVNPTPTVEKPASMEVCNDAMTTPVIFTQTIGKEVTGTIFSWTNDKPGIGLAGSGTGDIASFKAINLTNASIIATITVIPTATACPGAPKIFTITINPTPTVEKPASMEVCNDAMTTPVTFTQVTGKEVTGTTFSWTNDKPGIGLAGSGSGNIAGFKAINLTNAPIIATITVTPTATACPGIARTFTITVNPTPKIATPASFEVCNDVTTAPVIFAQVAGKEVTGTTFSWTNDKPGIGLAGSGTGAIGSFKAINLTNAPIVATITVIPTATACPGDAKTFTITVSPTPTVEKPSSIEVCNDATTMPVNFMQVAGKEVIGTTFSWTNDKPVIGLAGSGTGDIESFKAINLTNAPIIATITVTATATGCPGASKTFTITVNPTANVAKPLDQEICNNSLTAKVAFSGTVSGTSYRWTNNHPEIGLAASGIGAEIAAFSAINNTAVPIIATIQVTPSNGCEGETRSFTITVNPNAAIALTSAAATTIQTICVSTPLAAITYLVTNATGAAVTGLPAGLTGKYDGGIFTISGTPTIAGTFNYTVTTTGGCASASLSGTIKVNPNAEIALLSAVETVNQTVCINSPVAAIVYKVSNATGAAVTGLPDGLSGVYNPSTMEFRITGSSAQFGVFSYIVSTQGGCAIANLNGVIKVTPNSTIILSSDNGTDNQKVCVNTAIKQISYQTANASGAVVTGLPEELTGLYKDGLFTINGMPKVSGTFNYTVTTIAACQTASMQGTLVVHPNPIGFNDIVSNLTCANNMLNYQLQDNVNTISKGGNAVAALFSWTVAANQNVLGINIGSGNTITASLVNTSHVVQQVIYTVTPVSLLGGCPGTPFTVTVAVPVCSGLTLTKTADVNTVSQAGDLIKYTITVKNTASANHTGVTVTDPFLGGVLARPASGDNGNNILEANESWIYTGTYSVKQTDIDDNGKPTAATGNIINTATVITAEHSGILSASATVNIVTTGAVTLVKTGIMSRDFSTIVYTFKIKNTGKVKLAELDLKDIKIPGEISLGKNTIAVGETITGSATYMVTDQEKRDGRVVNTATVTGKTPAGDLVTDVSGTQENNDTPTEFIIDDVPQAVNDRAETIINQPTTFIVTENDMPSFNGLDKGSIIITRAPSNGQLIAHPDGTVTYTPNKGFSGQDDFMYTITDLKGKVSNKALVNITVTPIPVFIPNTFTPNGDGKNDTFKIIGRESFDTTDVLIFNRWGNEVYRNKNYNDEWDGSGLSEGTYYYLIILKKGDNQVSKKGWILIKR